MFTTQEQEAVFRAPPPGQPGRAPLPNVSGQCPNCGAFKTLAYTGDGRGLRTVQCVMCSEAVPADHPDQLDLDRQWREKEARDRQAAAAARPADAQPPFIATILQAAGDQDELRRQVAELRERLLAAEKRVEALERRRR